MIPATCPHVYVCPKCGNRIGTPIDLAAIGMPPPRCTRHTRATGGAQDMREITPATEQPSTRTRR